MAVRCPTTMALIAVSLLLAARAHGAFIPLEDGRVIRANVEYFGLQDSGEDRPSTPFGDFINYDFKVAVPDPDDEGECYGRTAQGSTLIPAIGYMAFTGGAEGGWTAEPFGTWSATSLARVKFHLVSCTLYNLSVKLKPGDCPSLAGIACTDTRLEGVNGIAYEEFEGGDTVVVHDRLPAGDYVLEARSGLTSSEESAGGGAYEVIWNCWSCPWSIIKDQPSDRKVPAGTDATLVASASVPAGHMGYQWRLGLVPLVDDGRISGTMTNTLTIHNVAPADTGYYDVVFTDSSDPDSVIVEPSRLAHLELETVTGVEGLAGGSPRAFALSSAVPNPFARVTSFWLEAARPTRMTMVIYNVAGAQVRILMDELVSGTRAVAWDGTTESGHRASAGIYYLRVQAGTVSETRKVVLLR